MRGAEAGKTRTLSRTRQSLDCGGLGWSEDSLSDDGACGGASLDFEVSKASEGPTMEALLHRSFEAEAML